MIDELFILFPLFFCISMLYSSAGFGGGSSYLAILALFSFEYSLIKSTALLCNIVVVSGGTFLFFKKGFLIFKKILPLIILSVPFAFLGGRFQMQESYFFLLLASTLLMAAVLLLIYSQENATKHAQHSDANNLVRGGIMGGGIGFLSGLVGIGGGIFLSPLLHLTHWGKAKTIAATASFFILVNSVAGLIGQASNTDLQIQWSLVLPLVLAVFLGGQIGSRLSASKLSGIRIKQITGLLILLVALRIFARELF